MRNSFLLFLLLLLHLSIFFLLLFLLLLFGSSFSPFSSSSPILYSSSSYSFSPPSPFLLLFPLLLHLFDWRTRRRQLGMSLIENLLSTWHNIAGIQDVRRLSSLAELHRLFSITLAVSSALPAREAYYRRYCDSTDSLEGVEQLRFGGTQRPCFGDGESRSSH